MNARRYGLWVLIVMSVLGTTVVPALVLAQDVNPIQYEQVVAGEITNDIPEIYYTFEGSAGDTIIVNMSSSNTGDFRLESYLELRGPDNQSLYTDEEWRWQWANPFSSLIGPVTLRETGTYTVIATRFMRQEGESSGQFDLVIKRVEVMALAVNETTTAEISNDTPGVFSYPGGSTDVYRLVGDRLEGIGGFHMEVRDPHGRFVNHNFGGHEGQLVLDAFYMLEAGEYLIVVRREVFYNQQGQIETAADRLRVALTLQPVETETIALDTTVSGTLSNENPSAYYTFTGSQGDRLRLTGSQSTPDDQPFVVTVVPPNGLAVIGAGTYWGMDSFVLDPLVLNVSGQHVLLVRRYEGTAEGLVPEEAELGPSEYHITLSLSQIPVLEVGVETTGTIEEASSEQVYRYDGVAGQTLRITLRSLSENYGPNMYLESPVEEIKWQTPMLGVHSSVPASLTFEVTLQTTGIYLFHVGNGMYSPDALIPGEFSLLVEVVE